MKFHTSAPCLWW